MAERTQKNLNETKISIKNVFQTLTVINEHMKTTNLQFLYIGKNSEEISECITILVNCGNVVAKQADKKSKVVRELDGDKVYKNVLELFG